MKKGLVFVLSVVLLMSLFLSACKSDESAAEDGGTQTQESATEQKDDAQAQSSESEQESTLTEEDNEQSQNAESEKESEQEETAMDTGIKEIIISDSDYDYTLADIILTSGDSNQIEKLFGFQKPSEEWYINGFSGYNSENPWETRATVQHNGSAVKDGSSIEAELVEKQIDTCTAYQFTCNENAEGAYSGTLNPCIGIALAKNNQISSTGDNLTNDISYLNTFLASGNVPEMASMEAFSEHSIQILEKEEKIDTLYDNSEIIYQVTSYEDMMSGASCVSEREIVILHLTNQNDLVHFTKDSEIAYQVMKYDILIEYLYPQSEAAVGYQHKLAELLPQMLK